MRVGWSSWSIAVSPGWNVTDDPEFIALERSEDGAFLLSSAIREDGDVGRDDIASFTERDGGDWGPPRDVRFGEFAGVAYAYVEEDEHWRRWFLCHGATLLLATYNGTRAALAAELEAVEAMLATLQPEVEEDDDAAQQPPGRDG